MRLVQEKFTEEEDIIKNHVSATWAYPQKIYVLTKTGNIFQVDMVKDKTYAILSDIMLGMISHKKSLITFFGHKHEIINFIKKFDIFHEKFQWLLDFGLYLE